MQANAEIFTRPLSLVDLGYASSGSRNHQKRQAINQCVIEGGGVLTEQTLHSAIEKVAVATPACRMVIRGRWGFKHWRADGPLPTLKIMHYSWDGHARDNLPFLDGPLDLFDGPVVEIIQVISDRTYLIFRIHHAVMDGVASAEFIQNFFRALRNETLESYDSPENNDTFTCAKDSPGQAITYSPALSPLDNAQNRSEPVDYARIWQRITLKGNDLLIMPKTMLALSGVARRNGAGLVRLRVPINLRRHQPELRASGNLIGIMTLDIDEQDSVRSLIKKFNRQLSENRELSPGAAVWARHLLKWTPFSLLELLARIINFQRMRANFHYFSATVSSVGAGSLADYSAGKFEAKTLFGIPVLPVSSPVFVAISSNPLTTEITVCAPKALATHQRLEMLCDELKRSLSVA